MLIDSQSSAPPKNCTAISTAEKKGVAAQNDVTCHRASFSSTSQVPPIARFLTSIHSSQRMMMTVRFGSVS
ncbi:hypothetical protein OPV22_012427 [Ensete ventricosum]|uniref:Uncharacterized protein n=1 Tax=Ensete ventricosum TaxID=4639 RepID=A0AAV8R2L7_ENSVE|nr:hypothetical protein OPV22_012427 [Ensete ventricosum]